MRISPSSPGWPAAASRRVVVAVPARNEAGSIGACVDALASQRGRLPDAVVVCLNNCTDDSAAVLRGAAARAPFPVEAIKVCLPAERARASVARRIAMDRAAGLAGPAGILLTTDADGQADPGWLAANLAAFARGADAVAGLAEIDPEGAALIPARLHAADAEECAYAALLDELAALLDPDPADPWPRHDVDSGASIGVTVAAYRACGGMPEVGLGEDRAFIAALRRIDARIRHAPEARVIVSARVEGRAPGGMADTIRRRIERMDEFLDDRLEPVADAVRRIRLRARLRRLWRGGSSAAATVRLARRLGLSGGELTWLAATRYFGTAWAEVEARSPRLQRRRVPVAATPRQTALARALRDAIRCGETRVRTEDPAGMPLPVAAAAD